MSCALQPLEAGPGLHYIAQFPVCAFVGTFNEDVWGYYWPPKSKHPVLLDASLNVCMFTTKARVPYIEDGHDPWIKDPEVAAAARELHEAAAQFDNVLADFNARCAFPASAEPDAEGPTCDKDIGDEVVSKEMQLKQEA